MDADVVGSRDSPQSTHCHGYVEVARQALANGTGVLKTAKLAGLGTGTVQRLKRDMEAAT